MPAPEEALSARNVTFTGYEGAEVNAYQALPAGDGPFPGVLVIHHLPGWDSGTKEITRRFAASGYNALCPNLYARQGLHVDPDDAAAATREAGGIPDDQFVGDADAAVKALRALPTSNGKVGVIGYCSGGRHSFLTAVSLPVDAAVDCYGAFVTGTVPDGFPLKVTPLVDRTPELQCPLLGLFGNDDQFPSPDQVDELERALKAANKTYEFHRYDGAGHAFFSVERPAFRPEAALDGWQRIFDWYGRYLAGELTMCSYLTVATEIAGSAKGPQGWFGVTSASVYFDHPYHAPFDHTLNIDFADPSRGPGARVAVELSAASARRLVESINEALAAAGAAANVTPSTGPAAGVHLPWAKVPEAVQTWAAEVGGGAPRAVVDKTGGFSPGATAVLDCPERSIFVKAVGATLNTESPEFHRREAAVSAALPPAPQLPELMSVFDDGDWVALAFAAVDGRPPAHPWDPSELQAAVGALEALHEMLTPNPVVGMRSAADRLAALFGGWTDLAELASPPVGLDEWAAHNLDRLAELESGWPDAVNGSTLLHCDVRSDNFLLTAGGVVLVDWPHACVGSPALDLVAWAPSVELEGGPAPESLLALHGAVSSVDRDVLAVLVAAFSGFLVRHSLQAPPPGLPTLRPFQAAQGAVALAWLHRVTGW